MFFEFKKAKKLNKYQNNDYFIYLIFYKNNLKFELN